MRNSGRLTMIRLLAFGVLVPSCDFLGADAPANSRTDRQNLWPRFVWDKSKRSATPGTEKSPDFSKLSRTWEWEPKTGKVYLRGQG